MLFWLQMPMGVLRWKHNIWVNQTDESSGVSVNPNSVNKDPPAKPNVT